MADKVSKKAQEYSKKIAKERERKYLRFSVSTVLYRFFALHADIQLIKIIVKLTQW